MLDIFMLFFFFKQKTAYEMRISDWSSDVSSSDLSNSSRSFAAFCDLTRRRAICFSYFPKALSPLWLRPSLSFRCRQPESSHRIYWPALVHRLPQAQDRKSVV